MRYKQLSVFCVVVGLLSGCSDQRSIAQTVDEAAVTGQGVAMDQPFIDEHNSANALDWSGSYQGIVRCEGECTDYSLCLTLLQPQHFMMMTRELKKSSVSQSSEGEFQWLPDGMRIRVPSSQGVQIFHVGENRVWLVNEHGDLASSTVLKRVDQCKP